MLRKMVLVILGSLFLCIGSAYAQPIYLDVGTYGNTDTTIGDADTETGLFDQMQIKAETTTTQFGTIDSETNAPTVGSNFSDDGTLNVTELLGASAVDDEFLNNTTIGYEMTAVWSGLEGEVTSSEVVTDVTLGEIVVQHTTYDPGTIMYLYIDDTNFSYGSSIGVADNVNFDDGDEIAQITILGGTGQNTFNKNTGEFIVGSSEIYGEFTSMTDNFWFSEAGIDLNTLIGFNFIITAELDQNTDDVDTLTGTEMDQAAQDAEALFQVVSNHDGSIDVNVIPEPTTMALFGLGLLSIAGISRRRRE